MLIGELATRAGTSARTLRYYEQQGLLRASRDARGYRMYDDAEVRVAHEIRTLLAAGFVDFWAGLVPAVRPDGPHPVRAGPGVPRPDHLRQDQRRREPGVDPRLPRDGHADLILFSGGRPVSTKVGLRPKSHLRNTLQTATQPYSNA